MLARQTIRMIGSTTCGPVLLDCLEDFEVCRMGLTCHFGLDVVTQATGPAECGSLAVPLAWEEEAWNVMHDLGFEQRVLDAAVFYHRLRDVSVVIHADDLVCAQERLKMWDGCLHQFLWEMRGRLRRGGGAECGQQIPRTC